MKDAFSIPIVEANKMAMTPGSVGHVAADRLMRYGLPSAGVGIAGATLLKVISDIRANNADRKAMDYVKNPPGQLTVTLPPEKLGEDKKKEAELETSVPGETPQQLAKRLKEGKVNADRLFQNASNTDVKILGIPKQKVKEGVEWAKGAPQEAIKKLKGVPNGMIEGVIKSNPAVFKGVQAGGGDPSIPKTAEFNEAVARGMAEGFVLSARKNNPALVPFPKFAAFQVARTVAPAGIPLGVPDWMVKTALLGWGGGPQKQQAPVNYLAQLPIDIATVGIPGLVAFDLLDKHFKRQEKAQLEKSIGDMKSEYSNLLLADMMSQPNMEKDKKKVASPVPLECLLEMSISELERMSPVKTAFFGQEEVVARTTSIPVALALLAGITAHNYTLDKERELDQYYNSEYAPPPQGPSRIKLVSAQPAVKEEPEPEPAKLEPKKVTVEGASKKAMMSVGAANLSLQVMDRLGLTQNPNAPTPQTSPEQVQVTHKIEREAPEGDVPGVEYRDQNSVAVDAPTGEVIVEAADPQALKFLRAHRKSHVDALTY